MAVAFDLGVTVNELESSKVDALGFLAGKRYTCYCGRSVVGSILCRDCAEEMAGYFRSAARRRMTVQTTAG
jgi:hypothetical protein